MKKNMDAEESAAEQIKEGLIKFFLKEKMTRRKNEDGTYPYLQANQSLANYLAGVKQPEIPM